MPPQHRVEVIVEIPKGSRNKYEMDHVTGELWLDRHLFTATTYPADYGFIRDTLGGDGDPLDALVLLNEPTFPGCHLWARPVGVFRMHDEAGDDAKILCVLADDPRWASIDDIDDVDHHLINEIRHFFEIYKDLEPGKSAEIGEWAGRDAAFVEIETARQRHVDHPH
jgi:inorganic pyrophosphatase